MGLLDQVLAAAQQVYPFTWLSLSLTALYAVIVLGILFAAIRNFFARRRARREADQYEDYVLASQPAPAEPAPPLLLVEPASLPAIEPEAVAPSPVSLLADLMTPPTTEPVLTEPVRSEPDLPDPLMSDPAAEVPAPDEVPEPLAHAAVLAPPAPSTLILAQPPALAPAPPAASDVPADDLTIMRGVGPRLAERLNMLGIFRFADLAMLSPEEAMALDARLGAYKGQLERDRWIEQAQMLAMGDMAGFEQQFATA